VQSATYGRAEIVIMGKYKDSYLVIYHGPIRGGKTASMTGDLALDMISGRRVFANYKIEFRYNGKDYAAEPLITDELMLIDKPDIKQKYTDCCIGWDEGALSMPALDFQTAQNKLTTQAMLLRGKLEANVYFCVQYLSMFAKNMRLQEDTLVFCHDMSFKYKNLERGAFISQAFQDISGRSTGETYEYSGQVFRQRFFAKLVWPIYDTKEMPESVVKQKIGIKDVRAALNGYELESQENDSYSLKEENDMVIDNLIGELVSMKQTTVSLSVIKSMAEHRTFQGSKSELSEILMNKGAIRMSNGLWSIKNSLVLA